MQNIEVEELGNNNYIVIIDGSMYEIYAPNCETAKQRAMRLHV